MTSQTNFHPSDELLRSYNEGILSTGMSVAISAHLEYCSECRSAAEHLVHTLAEEWAETANTESTQAAQAVEPASGIDAGLEAMLDRITAEPQVVSLEKACLRVELELPSLCRPLSWLR